MSEAINLHKRMAMYGQDEATHLKKGGKVKKFATGGSVTAYPESAARTLRNDSSQKQPMPKPTGKIATMKKGGGAKSGLTVMIAVGKPMKKAVPRGR